MRFVSVLLVVVGPTLAPERASACPEAIANEVSTDDSPATTSPCMTKVDFSRVQGAGEARYVVGAGGTSQSGVGQVGSVYAGVDIGYGLQFGGDPQQPSYEIELSAGAAGQLIAGDVDATGLITRAGLRLGPAQMNPSIVDEGRGNIAWFPLSMEIAHVGELAARPRLSARPDLARSLYNRERIELATRLVRVEGAGDKPQTGAPGMTEAKKPTSWAIDVIPLHAGLDVATQDVTRFETTIGGSMLGVTEHTTGMSIDVFGIQHRRFDLSMTEPMNLDTLWVLRVDGVDPYTGTRYYAGWGEVIDMPDREELGDILDPENGSITIGGIGWYAQRAWGGWGAQYKREPFVTMTGAVALEDRVSGEVYVPRSVGLVARVFGARTTRLVNGALAHAMTGGIELDATYVRKSWSWKAGLEVGRTFYTALDAALPESAGFGAQFGLTMQRAGRRSW